MRHNINTTQGQRGIALVTVLVMLTMLVLVAIVSMRATNTDLKIAKNSRDKSVAFRISTNTVDAVDDILADHMFYRGWSGFTMTAGYTVADSNSELYDTNVANPFVFDSTRVDLRYSEEDFAADIFVSRVGQAIATGASVGVGEGYSGIGRGAAGGGGSIFFDISSRSSFLNNSSSITGGYHRLIIRN